MTPDGWAIIIGAATLGAVNVITAWKAHKDNNRATAKLDTIHHDTNSRLEKQDEELKRVYEMNVELRELLSAERAKGTS